MFEKVRIDYFDKMKLLNKLYCAACKLVAFVKGVWYNKVMDESILKDFLESETAGNDDLAIGIIQFINDIHIRNGEYECNMYIVKKLDWDNLILYVDLTDSNGTRHVYNAFSISRYDLQEAIVNDPKRGNYEVPKELLSYDKDITFQMQSHYRGKNKRKNKQP